jgi:hypothetical protein
MIILALIPGYQKYRLKAGHVLRISGSDPKSRRRILVGPAVRIIFELGRWRDAIVITCITTAAICYIRSQSVFCSFGLGLFEGWSVAKR